MILPKFIHLRAHLSRRRTAARLARIGEFTAAAVAVTDLQGVIEWVNDGFTRITGYSYEEAIGRVPGQLLQGPDTDVLEKARIGVALRARQSVAAELVNYTKEGRQFWIGMNIEPLVNSAGEVDGFVARAADITERHEQRVALNLLTKRFHLATRAAHIGVFERKAGDQNIWWSEVMYDIFAQDPATFKPSLAAWLALVHPEDRKRVSESAGDTGRARSAHKFQYRVLLPDGSIRHIDSTETTDWVANRVAGVAIDVTARVQAEERERVLQERLRVSSHQAGMAEIATGVLHNVGNVLNSLGIANSTALHNLKTLRLDRLEQTSSLIRQHRANLDAYLNEDERGRHLPQYLATLSAQISTGARAVEGELNTIDGLLDHLREIVGAQQASARLGGMLELVDMRLLIDAAILQQPLDAARIEVVRLYDELPSVTTDRHKVIQILVNLIGNARDAIELSNTKSGQILIRLRRDGDHILLCVEDTGVGMPEDVLARLWRFGFTTKHNGHGFGLHNSANAARAIGGTIGATSDGAGRGSQFALRLPLNIHSDVIHGAAA
jgi:PAS domain S-box-containing protein